MKFSQKRKELMQGKPLFLFFFINTFLLALKLLTWILFVPFSLSSNFDPEEDFLEFVKIFPWFQKNVPVIQIQ